MAQPDLAPGAELGGDGAEGNLELSDLTVMENGAEQVEETLRGAGLDSTVPSSPQKGAEPDTSPASAGLADWPS